VSANSTTVENLRARLNDQSADLETLAKEASGIFHDAGMPERQRWLDLELRGFGTLVDVQPLHEVLGVAPDHELVAFIARYRQQPGITWESGDPGGRPFLHFFVEPISELKSASERVHEKVGTASVVLEFGPNGGSPTHPERGEFPRDVFDRVLLGLRATLHLQLGRIA
jgi:hypothetical protein